MTYVDGFLLPLPKKNVPAYRRLAKQAAKVWRDHGALDYRECIGNDLDVPGMRELKIGDAGAGVAAVFDDIEALAAQCRFSDCRHETEPGCAIQAALQSGALDERRLANWRKLEREHRHATETLAEKHKRGRQFAKAVRLRAELSHKKR